MCGGVCGLSAPRADGALSCRGVGFSFIFSWLLMLLVLLTFFLGGNIYMLVCDSWRSQQLFQVGSPPPLPSPSAGTALRALPGLLRRTMPGCSIFSLEPSSWTPPASSPASTFQRCWVTRVAPSPSRRSTGGHDYGQLPRGGSPWARSSSWGCVQGRSEVSPG